jgi:hypothetical protein
VHISIPPIQDIVGILVGAVKHIIGPTIGDPDVRQVKDDEIRSAYLREAWDIQAFRKKRKSRPDSTVIRDHIQSLSV